MSAPGSPASAIAYNTITGNIYHGNTDIDVFSNTGVFLWRFASTGYENRITFDPNPAFGNINGSIWASGNGRISRYT